MTLLIPRSALALALLLGAGAVQAQQADPFPAADVHAAIDDVGHVNTPAGIDETRLVDIGGIRQWIRVRGRDRRNPILLFIHGGPGSPESPLAWAYQSGWEDYFTVVQWDQRGTGQTAAANTTPGDMTVARMVADGVELTAYLRTHYAKQKIFVLGHSWGTVIGLGIAQRHPEWLHAYIGVGQFIDGQQNERVGYDWALERARETGNALALRELQAIAPYPGPAGALTPQQIITQRKWVIYFGGLTWGRQDFDYAERLDSLSGAQTGSAQQRGENELRAITSFLPELVHADFGTVTRLDCPMILFQGQYDYETPTEVAAKWFARLHAPSKRFVRFDNAAHMLQIEAPGRYLVHLVEDARPLATRAGDGPDDDTGDRTRQVQ